MEDLIPTPINGRELGNRYALHALRERRAEVSGELEDVERRVRYLRQALTHLDATLAFMEPGSDPKTIRPKKLRRKSKLFGAGKLNHHIMATMRKAERPLFLAQITAGVATEAGLGKAPSRGSSRGCGRRCSI